MEQIEKVIPKYGENIIVGVMFKGHFEWYAAPKELWKMDYKKLYSIWKLLYERTGKDVSELERDKGNYEKFCEKRWGIEVLDGFTASQFLAHLFNCRYSPEEFHLLKMVARDDRKNDYDVSMYIDFDKNRMYSQFPKPENFENFVPVGWKGEYKEFISLIPADKRF